MKKLIVLAVMLLALIVPNRVAAEDQEVSADTSVALIATRTSTYYASLPTVVDVLNNSVDFIVKVKGDITADKQLNITSGETATLSDSLGRSSVTVNVSHSGGPFTYDELPAEYNNSDIVTFTLTHATLGAGTYSGTLPITISLDNASGS
ncbi:MAG: hypothetical protein IJH00_05420 [Erysipelotrichaceae bacterium]|nr:hypothetical protein [Erysipelotrichaceae bacterium]